MRTATRAIMTLCVLCGRDSRVSSGGLRPTELARGGSKAPSQGPFSIEGKLGGRAPHGRGWRRPRTTLDRDRMALPVTLAP